MKIRKLTPEIRGKAIALLKKAFPNSNSEVQMVESFHSKNTDVHEWVCIHINSVIAYIAFSKAFKGNEVCGLHLGPFAVHPEHQKQGVGSELMQFALRQKEIKENTLFVLGDPGFFNRFGFEACVNPVSASKKSNAQFLSLRNNNSEEFVVEYESVFNNQGSAGKKRKK